MSAGTRSAVHGGHLSAEAGHQHRPADGTFDTSRGTIHLHLGRRRHQRAARRLWRGSASGLPQAKVITKPNRPVPGDVAGTFTKPGADALEDAIWSARRDTETGYGIAVFDLDPGIAGGKTSITIRYYHAPEPTGYLRRTTICSKRWCLQKPHAPSSVCLPSAGRIPA
jgi:hypothetical protein